MPVCITEMRENKVHCTEKIMDAEIRKYLCWIPHVFLYLFILVGAYGFMVYYLSILYMYEEYEKFFFESNAIYAKLLLYQKKKKNASGAVTVFPGP